MCGENDPRNGALEIGFSTTPAHSVLSVQLFLTRNVKIVVPQPPYCLADLVLKRRFGDIITIPKQSQARLFSRMARTVGSLYHVARELR
jgi:hypothetical protein